MTRVGRCPLVSVPLTVMPSAKALGIQRNRPLRAASAILADALSLGDPANYGIDPFSPQPDPL